LEVSLLNLRLWHVVLGVVVLLFLGGFVGERIAILRTLVRTNKRTRMREDEAALEKTEQEMVGQSPEEWAELHVRLLQSLESASAPEDYQQALETIRDAINHRLERGIWREGHLQFPDDDGA
jgi:hypothetical protein